jgi:hypothetical protein
LAVLALSCVALSGCGDDYSTPSGIVKTAGYYLRKNDFDHFSATLSPEGFYNFGSYEKFVKLRAKLENYTDVSLGDETPISHSDDGYSRTYLIAVYGKAPHASGSGLIMSVKTSCVFRQDASICQIDDAQISQ